jgi:hypothetical protein
MKTLGVASTCAPAIVDERILAQRIFRHMEFRHLGLVALHPSERKANGNPDLGVVLVSIASDDLRDTIWATLVNDSLRSGDQSVS